MRIFIYEPGILLRKHLIQLCSEQIPNTSVIPIDSMTELMRLAYQQESDIVLSGLTLNQDWNYREWLETGAFKNKPVIFLIEKIHAAKFFIHDIAQTLNISVLLTDETDVSHLIDGIHCCLKGQVFRSSYIQTLVTRFRKEIISNDHLLEKLSSREKEYLQLYCETLSPSEIANRMNISISTVNSYKEKVLLKFNLDSVHELIQLCAHDELMRSFFPKPEHLVVN